MQKSKEQIAVEIEIALNKAALDDDPITYFFTMTKSLRYAIENRKAIREKFTSEDEELVIRIFNYRMSDGYNIRSVKSAQKHLTDYIRGKIRKAMKARIKQLENSDV